jgi:hypothetical protein
MWGNLFSSGCTLDVYEMHHRCPMGGHLELRRVRLVHRLKVAVVAVAVVVVGVGATRRKEAEAPLVSVRSEGAVVVHP